MTNGFPYVGAGQSVGLLGGSFDPAHEGHVHITLEAMKRFGLDHVWWLVSPGNPLKTSGPAPLEKRMMRARALMQHPRVMVTDIEARLGTRYTAETVGVLARPGERISARTSAAARIFAPYRLAGRASHMLGQAQAPAWCFVNVPMTPLSSTALRASGAWSASE